MYRMLSALCSLFPVFYHSGAKYAPFEHRSFEYYYLEYIVAIVLLVPRNYLGATCQSCLHILHNPGRLYLVYCRYSYRTVRISRTETSFTIVYDITIITIIF